VASPHANFVRTFGFPRPLVSDHLSFNLSRCEVPPHTENYKKNGVWRSSLPQGSNHYFHFILGMPKHPQFNGKMIFKPWEEKNSSLDPLSFFSSKYQASAVHYPASPFLPALSLVFFSRALCARSDTCQHTGSTGCTHPPVPYNAPCA
jgi:hypothetical protein